MSSVIEYLESALYCKSKPYFLLLKSWNIAIVSRQKEVSANKKKSCEDLPVEPCNYKRDIGNNILFSSCQFSQLPIVFASPSRWEMNQRKPNKTLNMTTS